MAQLGARFHGMEEVIGSIPIRSTKHFLSGCNDIGSTPVICCSGSRASPLLPSATARKNIPFTFQGERITAVAPPPAGAVDLSAQTYLPGLINAHTHVLLQGDVTAADYDVQLLKRSQAFRAILAARLGPPRPRLRLHHHPRLETEGAGYTDVDVKHASEQGGTPARACASPPAPWLSPEPNPLLGYNFGLDLPKGVLGPLTYQNDNVLLDRLGPEGVASITLFRTADKRFANVQDKSALYSYEILNFVDGDRSFTDICDAVVAEFGPIPTPTVANFLDACQKADILTYTH